MNYKFEIDEEVTIVDHSQSPLFNGEKGIITECNHHNGFNYYKIKLSIDDFPLIVYEEEIENLPKRREEKINTILNET